MPPENETPGECATCADNSPSKIASRSNTIPNMIAYKPQGERGPTVYRDMTGIAPEHMARLNGAHSSMLDDLVPQFHSIANSMPFLLPNPIRQIVLLGDVVEPGTAEQKAKEPESSNPQAIPKVPGEQGRPTKADDPNWRPPPNIPENPGPGDHEVAGGGKVGHTTTATDDQKSKLKGAVIENKDGAAYDELEKEPIGPPPAEPKLLNCPMKVRHKVEIFWIVKSLVGETWNGAKKQDAVDLGEAAIAAVDPDAEIQKNIGKVPEQKILEYLRDNLRWKCAPDCELVVSIAAMQYSLSVQATIEQDTEFPSGRVFYHVWLWRTHTLRAFVDIECKKP